METHNQARNKPHAQPSAFLASAGSPVARGILPHFGACLLQRNRRLMIAVRQRWQSRERVLAAVGRGRFISDRSRPLSPARVVKVGHVWGCPNITAVLNWGTRMHAEPFGSYRSNRRRGRACLLLPVTIANASDVFMLLCIYPTPIPEGQSVMASCSGPGSLLAPVALTPSKRFALRFRLRAGFAI
jgi:hypothetical protein